MVSISTLSDNIFLRIKNRNFLISTIRTLNIYIFVCCVAFGNKIKFLPPFVFLPLFLLLFYAFLLIKNIFFLSLLLSVIFLKPARPVWYNTISTFDLNHSTALRGSQNCIAILVGGQKIISQTQIIILLII